MKKVIQSIGKIDALKVDGGALKTKATAIWRELRKIATIESIGSSTRIGEKKGTVYMKLINK